MEKQEKFKNRPPSSRNRYARVGKGIFPQDGCVQKNSHRVLLLPNIDEQGLRLPK